MDSFVVAERQKWERLPFGGIAESGTKYVACLILIALKMALGFDDHSEYKISDFAVAVNVALKLKASSIFTSRNDGAGSNSDMATLFVFKEWERFIKHRRNTLALYHVPTAIRTGKTCEMDSSSAPLEYFSKPDELRFEEKIPDKVSHRKRREKIIDILEEITNRIAEKSIADSPSKPPSAKFSLDDAFITPNDGLADQLPAMDPEQFNRLRQSFPDSSLSFIHDPKNLAEKLQPEGFNLYVCRGPAYSNVSFYMGDFVAAGNPLSIEEQSFARCSTKPPIPLDPELVPVMDPPTTGNKDLILHQPGFAYWTRDVRAKAGLNAEDWDVLKDQLPKNFLWLLELVAESVGEKSSDLYFHLVKVEKTIIRRSTEDHGKKKKKSRPKFKLY